MPPSTVDGPAIQIFPKQSLRVLEQKLGRQQLQSLGVQAAREVEQLSQGNAGVQGVPAAVARLMQGLELAPDQQDSVKNLLTNYVHAAVEKAAGAGHDAQDNARANYLAALEKAPGSRPAGIVVDESDRAAFQLATGTTPTPVGKKKRPAAVHVDGDLRSAIDAAVAAEGTPPSVDRSSKPEYAQPPVVNRDSKPPVVNRETKPEYAQPPVVNRDSKPGAGAPPVNRSTKPIR